MTAAGHAPVSLKPLKPLRGVRILSLALNLPGPAALMRLKAMGATCTKVEPPGTNPSTSGDPMGAYNLAAYDAMHGGVKVITLDLKTDKGQAALHKALARTDVLLTSFRPSALKKLGLSWAGVCVAAGGPGGGGGGGVPLQNMQTIQAGTAGQWNTAVYTQNKAPKNHAI